MITIKNVKTLDGDVTDFHLNSIVDQTIEAKEQLLLIPGVIDSHISLGSPAQENWAFGVESAVRGGITTLLDIPSEGLPSNGKEGLEQKKQIVDQQLTNLKIPLYYFPYFKANSDDFEELGSQKKWTLGSLLLFTPERRALDEKMWDRIFQIAAWKDLPVVINSRNENAWQRTGFLASDETLLEKAIHYAERQNTRLYVLNVANRNEMDLIQQARSRSLLIYAETTPQHLFPWQASSETDFLWEALNKGMIEAIGSGYHAYSQGQERLLWQGANFDVLNPIFLLPLLLTASHEKKLSIEAIVRLTRVNLYDIFKLERRDESFVLVDLEKEQGVQRVNKGQTMQMKLRGWPEYIILKDHLFKSGISGYHLTHVE